MKYLLPQLTIMVALLALVRFLFSASTPATPDCNKELTVASITVKDAQGKTIDVSTTAIAVIASSMADTKSCDYVGFYDITYEFVDGTSITVSATYKVQISYGDVFLEDYLAKCRVGDKIILNCKTTEL